MTKSKFFVDGKAEAVRERIKFKQFALDESQCSEQELSVLASMPKMDTGCEVRVNPNRSGSAFAQMTELAILAGYIRTDFGIKALIVWTERPNDNGTYDFGFVPLSSFKLPKRKLAPLRVPKGRALTTV